MERCIYSQPVEAFVDQSGEIHNILHAEVIEQRSASPSVSEVESWRVSLPKLADVLDIPELRLHQILLEFIPPCVGRNERADAVILGRKRNGQHCVLVIENKNWHDSGIRPHPNSDLLTIGVDEKFHPSVQALRYASQVRTYHGAVTNGRSDVAIAACAFLPLTKKEEHPVLHGKSFRQQVSAAPIFVSKRHESFREYILNLMPLPPDEDFVRAFEDAEYQPAASLLDMAKGIFSGDEAFQLSDEQSIAFNEIARAVEGVAAGGNKNKSVFVVAGGPGTGKSVIGLKLLGMFATKLGGRVLYAAGNSSFQVNLAGRLSKAVKDKEISEHFDFEGLFTNFRAFSDTLPSKMDLIICDEAQRLQPDSSTQYRKVRVPIEQSQEIIQASKVSVFLMDENQRVRNNDVGSVQRLQQTARFLDASFFYFNLITQFRCANSERYIASLNSAFGLKGPEDLNAPPSDFVFEVVDSPEKVESKLNALMADGEHCRILAGYCWPWTKTKSRKEGLAEDVVIGDWRRPWNRSDNSGGKAYNRINYGWANEDSRANEIGCIHTSHGIEFDYVGVLMGGDLIYREGRGWTVDASRIHDRGFKSGISKDKHRMGQLLRNIYRTLLTRGRKGCFVYCMDSETAGYLRDVIEP